VVREEKSIMSREAQTRLIEGARKGGKAEKHFTSESKERQREGARKGGQHSHMHDSGRSK
jgi:general stress protein YciG